MSDTKHTPGPWGIVAGTQHFFIRTSNGRVDGGIGRTTGDDIWDEANARLIAAAPDLLEVAKNILKRAWAGPSTFPALRAAITKAEGVPDAD